MNDSVVRTVQERRPAQASLDGAGVAIQRVAGFGHAGMDPVLMIDELRSEHREDFAAGFPPHPHRGMQTLTYMKHGGIVHEDSQGNRGEIRGGGAQYMSAGRGIIHSEMPTQDSSGLHGFQLWFNLPRAEKMGRPRYRDLPRALLAQATIGAATLTAISGDWQAGSDAMLRGPAARTRRAGRAGGPRPGGARDAGRGNGARRERDGLRLRRRPGHAGRVCTAVSSCSCSGPADQLQLGAGDEGVGCLLLRGRPLREPVVHYGPFVMNTREEIEEALRDYQSGRFAA
jgi:redox-sensitive bicupin YhaK (pirin superfamily)